jgi:nucleoside-diphosphate-sugar epimerase
MILEKRPGRCVFNVGYGRSITVESVVSLVGSVWSDDNCPESMKAIDSMYTDDFRADVGRIQTHVGWLPEYDLVEGIREMVFNTTECKGM